MVFLGNYFLGDNGYANCEGFSTLFKNVRYHLKGWGVGTQRPQNARELFNLRHNKARNIIEQAFAVLKMRWRILRSASFYIQIRVIMSCFLLHNFIRGEMSNDPIEQQIAGDTQLGVVDDADGEVEYVDQVETSTAWTQMREDLANSMWNNVCIFV